MFASAASTFRPAAVFLVMAAVLLGCARREIAAEPEPIGDFRLGHAIVLAENATKGPFSRDAEEEELESEIAGAVRQRLGRYDGDGLYHLGIKVGGYVLAQPGIPLVYAPRSVLLIDVNVFDNTTQARLNEEPERIVAFEGIENAVPVLGSGLTRSKEEQLENLAFSAALKIEQWLRETPQWFEPEPGAQRVEFPPELPDEAPSN